MLWDGEGVLAAGLVAAVVAAPHRDAVLLGPRDVPRELLLAAAAEHLALLDNSDLEDLRLPLLEQTLILLICGVKLL